MYILAILHFYISNVIDTNILVVDHLHQTELSKGSLGICLILEWLHQFLDCHLLSSLVVQCRAVCRERGREGNEEGRSGRERERGSGSVKERGKRDPV